VGDIIFSENRRTGSQYPCRVQRLLVSSRYHSWVIVDRDIELWNKVVADLCSLNKNLSQEWIESELQALVGKYRDKGWQLSGISQDSTLLIDTIRAERGEKTTVFLPVWGLILEVPTFTIGDVHFWNRAECKELNDGLGKLEDAYKIAPSLRVQTVAITEATGDIRSAVSNAKHEVNQALNIFRAFKYPTVESRIAGYKQISISGDFLASPKYYLAKVGEWNSHARTTTSEGFNHSGVLDVVIDNYLVEAALPRTGFYKLSEFLVSECSRFQSSLVRGAEWLGEATKPDRLESKFLKVAFAIDAMVGQEAPDIPDKGKRARIAERSAFLLCRKHRDRKRVYDEIHKFIEKRDALAHGASESISEWDTERFGTYARTVLTTLLVREPSFKSTDDLAKWVQWQSFKG